MRRLTTVAAIACALAIPATADARIDSFSLTWRTAHHLIVRTAYHWNCSDHPTIPEDWPYDAYCDEGKAVYVVHRWKGGAWRREYRTVTYIYANGATKEVCYEWDVDGSCTGSDEYFAGRVDGRTREDIYTLDFRHPYGTTGTCYLYRLRATVHSNVKGWAGERTRRFTLCYG
jgi:hypothetical protein